MPEKEDGLKPEGAGHGAGEDAQPPARPSLRLRQRFHRRYGKAMATWAALENILCHWFIWAVKPAKEGDPQMAEIFYSARSFNGSADMLKAAFYADSRDEDLSEFFRAAINRTMGYYAFRNKLAHYISTYDPEESRMILLSPSELHGKVDRVTERDLVIATKNFRFLWRIWLSTHPFVDPSRLLEPRLGLLCIDSLPAEAHSTEPSQKQRGRQRQLEARRASRG